MLRQPGAYERLFATGRTLMDGLKASLARARIKAQVIGEPPLFDVVFAEGEMKDYRDTARGDAAMMKRFNLLLRENGVLKGDSKFYVSLAHDAQDIATALRAFDAAAKGLA